MSLHVFVFAHSPPCVCDKMHDFLSLLSKLKARGVLEIHLALSRIIIIDLLLVSQILNTHSSPPGGALQ